MRRWKKFGHGCLRLLGVPVWLAAVLTMLSAVGLAAAFSGLAADWVGYGVYALSAYTLCVDGALVWRIAPRVWGRAKQNAWVRRYRGDLSYRAEVSVRVSLAVNLVYALFKGWAGVWYHSIWFGTLAFYYTVLALARFSLVRSLKREETGTQGWRRYAQTGWLVLLLTLVLGVLGTMMIFRRDRLSYPGYVIYLAALYAFYAVINAVRNLIRYRSLAHPVYSASKAISLVTALVSLFSMQTAMLVQFGEDEGFYRLMSCLTGASVFLLVAGLAIYMIRTGGKMKKAAQA